LVRIAPGNCVTKLEKSISARETSANLKVRRSFATPGCKSDGVKNSQKRGGERRGKGKGGLRPPKCTKKKSARQETEGKESKTKVVLLRKRSLRNVRT